MVLLNADSAPCTYFSLLWLQVAALQTEAVLDVLTDEWVVNTPDEGAIKWWIGNAAEDGRAATVFARLKVPAQDGAWAAAARCTGGRSCKQLICCQVPAFTAQLGGAFVVVAGTSCKQQCLSFRCLHQMAATNISPVCCTAATLPARSCDVLQGHLACNQAA